MFRGLFLPKKESLIACSESYKEDLLCTPLLRLLLKCVRSPSTTALVLEDLLTVPSKPGSHVEP